MSSRNCKWQLLPIAIFFLCMHVVTSSYGLAQSPNGSNRKALRRGTDPVWANTDEDAVTLQSDQLARTDVDDRHNSIQAPQSGTSWFDRLFGSTNSSSTGSPNIFGNLGDLIAAIWRILWYLIIAALIAAVIYFLYRTKVLHSWFVRGKTPEKQENIEQQLARISDLPFELEKPIAGLRSQADQLRQQGDYSKAIAYLFSYALVELDAGHRIRLEKGKTNGVYLRELRQEPALHGFLAQTTSVFEQSFFGRHIISKETFHHVWDQLPRFEKDLAAATRAIQSAPHKAAEATIAGVGT